MEAKVKILCSETCRDYMKMWGQVSRAHDENVGELTHTRRPEQEEWGASSDSDQRIWTRDSMAGSSQEMQEALLPCLKTRPLAHVWRLREQINASVRGIFVERRRNFCLPLIRFVQSPWFVREKKKDDIWIQVVDAVSCNCHPFWPCGMKLEFGDWSEYWSQALDLEPKIMYSLDLFIVPIFSC